MANEIKLPALKEGVDSVEVNAVKVAPGDVVAKDQTLLEVQADKAALDVPSPVGRPASRRSWSRPATRSRSASSTVVIESTRR